MLLDARAQFTDLFEDKTSSVFLGSLLCMMNLLPKGITLNGFILPQETDQSTFHWMPAQSLITECPSYCQKGLFSLDHGSFESLVESVKLEIEASKSGAKTILRTGSLVIKSSEQGLQCKLLWP